MKAVPTSLAEVWVIEPDMYIDERGFFFESFNQKKFAQTVGAHAPFLQDNHSRSGKGVLRGLHYQLRQPQGKLVRVAQGAIFDVAVDIRRTSATFMRWVGVELTSDNRRQLWIPPGFAHGFTVIGEGADVLYKTTSYYAAEHERTIRWDDPQLAVDWPLSAPPILSARDSGAPVLGDCELPD